MTTKDKSVEPEDKTNRAGRRASAKQRRGVAEHNRKYKLAVHLNDGSTAKRKRLQALCKNT